LLTVSGSNLTSTRQKKNYGSHPKRGLSIKKVGAIQELSLLFSFKLSLHL
jgi:hypothetical protein